MSKPLARDFENIFCYEKRFNPFPCDRVLLLNRYYEYKLYTNSLVNQTTSCISFTILFLLLCPINNILTIIYTIVYFSLCKASRVSALLLNFIEETLFNINRSWSFRIVLLSKYLIYLSMTRAALMHVRLPVSHKHTI